MTPTQALALWSAFLICVGGLSYAVYLTYPDRPSAPKIYEGGLDRELGGAGSARVSHIGLCLYTPSLTVYRPTKPAMNSREAHYKPAIFASVGRR